MCISNIGVRFLTISQWHDFYRQKQNVDVKYKEVLRLLNFFSEVLGIYFQQTHIPSNLWHLMTKWCLF